MFIKVHLLDTYKLYPLIWFMTFIYPDTLRIHGCQICRGINDAPNVCNLHVHKRIIDAFWFNILSLRFFHRLLYLKILLCDECDAEYHMYCLEPLLTKVPLGDWFCPVCVTQKFHPSRKRPFPKPAATSTLVILHYNPCHPICLEIAILYVYGL